MEKCILQGSINWRVASEMLRKASFNGKKMEAEVKSFIKVTHKKGIIENSHTIMATATGVVVNHDANLLFKNSGYVEITKSWVQRLLEWINLVKRKGTTTIKVLPSNFEKLKKQFLSDVCTTVVMEEIPEELIINWDQTSLKYLPVSNWALQIKGLSGLKYCSWTGQQTSIDCTCAAVMYHERWTASHSSYLCWENTHLFTESWLSQWLVFDINWKSLIWQTMMGYLHNILIPYVNATQIDLKLSKTHSCLVMYDTFNGQTTPDFLKLLEKNKIMVVEIPPNCTDWLQPLDLAVNKPLKDQMKKWFQQWYSEEVEKRIRSSASDDKKLIDMKLSQLKPLWLKWMVDVCSYTLYVTGFAKGVLYVQL